MAASMPGRGRPIEPGRIGWPGMFATMIPPVSVCHQLSWNGRPMASTPQRTPSACSGSPTLAATRSRDRSYSWATSAPSRISRRIAVGAVYQTVTRWSWRMRYHRSASKSPSSTMQVTPWVSGATMP